MDIEQIKKLLLEDMQYKKTFNNSMYPFPCRSCKNTVGSGDEFVFLGDKQKICTNCLGEIIEYLESL